MIYEPLIEKLMQYFSSENFSSEVVEAKKNFFEQAGIFDEEASDFEMKISQFVDWYLFTRPLSSTGRTPVEQAANEENLKWDESESLLYKNLVSHRHSLFEYLKSKGSELHVRDLFSDYKMVVKESPVSIGFSRDELFEARLFPYGDSFVFGLSFCFHPPEAMKFIRKEIKKVKKISGDERDEARESLIRRFFRMRYKLEQYNHVALEQIYTNESKLRI